MEDEPAPISGSRGVGAVSRLLGRAMTGVSSGRYRTAQRHVVGLAVGGWWASTLLGIGLAKLFAASTVHTLADARYSVHLGVAAAAFQALAAALCMMNVFQITRLQVRSPVLH